MANKIIKQRSKVYGARRTGIGWRTTLAELWENGAWTLPPVRSEATVQLHIYLSTITLSNSRDAYAWSPSTSNSDRFKVGEIYDLLRTRTPPVTWYKAVWSTGPIPRHQLLTWLFVLNRSPTRDRLLNWGLQTDPTCLLCNSAPESRNHIYFESHFSWSIWNRLASKCGFYASRNWDTNLTSISALPTSSARHKLLRVVWQAIIYHLWSERNSRLHRQHFSSLETITKLIHRFVKDRISSLRPLNLVVGSKIMQIWLA